MNAEHLVKEWFEKWEKGDYLHLPIAEHFKHTSPFGTTDGRTTYLNLVKANEEKFLGQTFDIHDGLYDGNHACVRYTARQGQAFKLDVSEWYYIKNDLIESIVAYYHIGDIRDDRKLKS